MLPPFNIRPHVGSRDSSSSQAAQTEGFCWAYLLSLQVSQTILNWSNSTTRLTIQLSLYSVYIFLIVTNYYAFFFFYSACLCLKPTNIAASVTVKITAIFQCTDLWMQDLIALKMCSTYLKFAVSFSLLSLAHFSEQWRITLSYLPITSQNFSQKELVNVLSLLIRSFMSSLLFLWAHDMGI